MKNKSAIASDTWLTPIDFYLPLNDRFGFANFDPCPADNDIFLFDGLKVDWMDRTYCNPPYSRKIKEDFIIKAHKQSLQNKLVVLLLPVSTSTKIFHNLILPNAKVEFLKGRLKFEGIDGDGNWVNPNCGMGSLKNIPENAKQVNRSGQNDNMIVIFGEE